MKNERRWRMGCSSLMVVVTLAGSGCDPGGGAEGLVGDAGAGMPPMVGGPGSRVRNSPMRAIMKAIDTRNASSLTRLIQMGLNADAPDWPTLDRQSTDYVEQTVRLAKLDPPQGSKESWDDLTSAFHATAEELQQAIKAQKRDEARTAVDQLWTSCRECHIAHRGGRGGRGGPPGPPGGFVPPKGNVPAEDGPPRG